MTRIPAIFLVTLLAACQSGPGPTPLPADSRVPGNQGGHDGHHQAPHGGTLIVLGDEFAHLEFVLDPGTGGLTLYVLDGEAERPIRLGQKTVEVEIQDLRRQEGPDAPASPERISLSAAASPLTGETIGDTARFEAASPRLIGVAAFEARVLSVTVRGREYRNVRVSFPRGNE